MERSHQSEAAMRRGKPSRTYTKTSPNLCACRARDGSYTAAMPHLHRAPSSRVRQKKLGGAGVSKVHQPARLQSLNFTIPTRLSSQEGGVHSRAFVTEDLREERRKVGPQILREPPFFPKCPEPVAWPEAQVLTSEDGGPRQQSSQWAT